MTPRKSAEVARTTARAGLGTTVAAARNSGKENDPEPRHGEQWIDRGRAREAQRNQHADQAVGAVRGAEALPRDDRQREKQQGAPEIDEVEDSSSARLDRCPVRVLGGSNGELKHTCPAGPGTVVQSRERPGGRQVAPPGALGVEKRERCSRSRARARSETRRPTARPGMVLATRTTSCAVRRRPAAGSRRRRRSPPAA